MEWLAIPFLGDLPSPGIEFTACAVSPSLLADSFPTEPQGKPKVKVLVAQLCPTLCYPVDCSPPGSSVHGILQARILEWVAIPFSRGYSQPRSPAHSLPSEPAGKLFTWAFTSCQIFAECLDMSLLTLTYKCLNCSAHSLLKESKEIKRKWSRSSCLTLCNPMNCSLPGSSIHGILQARILEWVAISFSKGSSRPRNRTKVSHIAGRRFTLWATREALKNQKCSFITCPRNSTKHLEKE